MCNKHYFGKCLCGDINIEITGEINAIIHCHCSKCRKASGTAFATNGFVNVDDFKVTKGKHKLRSYCAIEGKCRFFCGKCGTPVYSSNIDDAKRLRLRLGILDTDIIERPMSHNFVTSKANWETLETSLPQYEKHEPGR